jgi:hypothetical protein
MAVYAFAAHPPVTAPVHLRETPQIMRNYRKRMPNRKRGGQPGNRNAVKDGRHSAPVRAARLAAYEEQQRRSNEWMKKMPAIDYGAIIDGLRVLKQRKEAAAKE